MTRIQTGITESVNPIQPLARSRPAKNPDSTLSTLLTAVGATSELMTAALQAEQRQAEAEQARADREAKARERLQKAAADQAELITTEQQGLGARDAKMLEADLEARIQNGELGMQAEETYAQSARRIVSSLVDADFHPAYRDRFTTTLEPFVADKLKSAHDTAMKTARESQIAMMAASFASAPTLEDKMSALRSAMQSRRPDESMTDTFNAVVLPAANAVVTSPDPDPEQWSQIRALFQLPDGSTLMPDKVQELENKLAASMLAKESRTQSAAHGEYLDQITRATDNTNLEALHGKVLKDERLTPEHRAKLASTLNSQIEARQKQAAELRENTEADALRAAHIEHATIAMEGGWAGQPLTLESQTSTGKAVTMNDADTKAAVFSAVRQRATQAFNTPAAQNAYLAKWAQRAGYVPQEWSSELEHGGRSLSSTSVLKANAGQLSDADVPANAIRGLELFRLVRAEAPGVADALTLSPRSRKMYQQAAALMDITGVTAPTALRQIAMQIDKPPAPSLTGNIAEQYSRAVDDASASESFSWWRAADGFTKRVPVQNRGEVAAEIKQLADIFIEGGLDAHSAVHRAKYDVARNRVTVNGWSVRVQSIHTPESLRTQDGLNTVAGRLIAKYVNGPGAAYGFEAADLTLSPVRPGWWKITDARRGMSVPGEGSAVFFTTEALIRELAAHETENNQQTAEAISSNAKRKAANAALARTLSDIDGVRLATDTVRTALQVKVRDPIKAASDRALERVKGTLKSEIEELTEALRKDLGGTP